MQTERDYSKEETALQHLRDVIELPGLPLAVYREVAAHLRQVTGVETGLLPQKSHSFDYFQSQIGGLWIEYMPTHDPGTRAQVEKILNYYADRFGQWQAIEES